jgi:hypothetical protein
MQIHRSQSYLTNTTHAPKLHSASLSLDRLHYDPSEINDPLDQWRILDFQSRKHPPAFVVVLQISYVPPPGSSAHVRPTAQERHCPVEQIIISLTNSPLSRGPGHHDSSDTINFPFAIVGGCIIATLFYAQKVQRMAWLPPVVSRQTNVYTVIRL